MYPDYIHNGSFNVLSTPECFR